MQNVFLKPAPLSEAQQGRLGRTTRVVPDPQQAFRPLAVSGEWKPLTSYWTRRLRDGDVVKAEPPPAAVKKGPAPAAAGVERSGEPDEEKD